MIKKNKIYITLNDLDAPNTPANYGVELAKRLERPVTLNGSAKPSLYTQPTIISPKGIENSLSLEVQAIEKIAVKKIHQICAELKKIHPLVDYNIEVGVPESNTLSDTQKDQPYMVVLEKNSELTSLHEWFGTHETRLAEGIDCPVLTLPNNYTWQPVNRILYLMDMEDETVDNMRILTTIAKDLEAQLTVVVIDDQKETKVFQQTTNVLKNLLGYDSVDFHQIVAEESAAVVEGLIKSTGANWLAFEHKSYSFIERLFDDYNTKRLILQSEVPVLVF